MKILFVTNQIPYPPDNGVRIPTYHAMRIMHSNGHELALAVLSEEEDAEGSNLNSRLQEIGKFCKNNVFWFMPLLTRSRTAIMMSAITTNLLYFVARYRQENFKSKLLKTIGEFRPDVIHFDLITLSQYEQLTPPGVGRIASINDSYALTLENALEAGNYSGLEILYRKIQLLLTKQYEATIYPRFNYVHVMTDVDEKYLKTLNPKIHCRAIANGVAPELFDLAEITLLKKNVIFVGNLVAENIIYLEKLLRLTWPVIRSAEPETELHIVGRIHNQVRHLVNKYNGRNGVIFTGYVNNLVDAYKNCGIALTPINKDCGILNKAIEAMAAGMAVIGFNKSFSGIQGGILNKHFLASDDYLSMGRTTVTLLRDPSKHAFIQKNAHILARQNYSWETRAIALEEMYTQAAISAKTKNTIHTAH